MAIFYKNRRSGVNQKVRVCFVVLCLSAFIIQGCSKKDKTNSTPPPVASAQKTETIQEATPKAVPASQPTPAKWVEVTPETLRTMIAANKDLFILDVRNPEELVSGPAPLKNAVNIPLPELSSRYTELPRDKEIVVVCRAGHRSATAADFLTQAGFIKIYSLAGGMSEYRASEK
ncbi:MAG: rhodanese-like domain-containing protein [bacterium]